jgi:outer membrane protein TolC
VSFVRQNNTYGPQFGLSVRFNLFNGGNDRRRVINEEINKENTQLNYNNTVSLIKTGVVEKYFHYSSLLQQLKLARENLAAAQRSLDIATFQFESGAIDGYDFRQTQLTLIEINNRFRRIEFRLKSAEVQINRLTGSLLNAYLQ